MSTRWKTGSEPRFVLSWILIFALAGSSMSVQAQPTAENQAIAEALFREARKLMDKDNFVEACPKLEESFRLDPAQGTLLNLAVCHEKVGRTATAWSEFIQAQSQAKKEGNAAREQLAKDRIKELEPKLARLNISVPPNVAKIPGIKITRNGTVMGAAIWGTEVPVDPGNQVIEISAPDYKAVTLNKQVAPEQRVTITVPELTPAPRPVVTAPAASGSASATPIASANPEPPPPQAYWNTRRTTGVVLGSVGIIGLGIGTYFGITALSKRSDSDGECPGGRCTVRGVSLNDDAKTAARISDFGIGLGLIGVIAGGYLFFTAGSSQPTTGAIAPPTKIRIGTVDVVPLQGGGAAALGGTW